MSVRLPPIPRDVPPNVAHYLRSLSQYVEMVTAAPPIPSAVQVMSPDKSIWEIRVSNTGATTAVKVKNA